MITEDYCSYEVAKLLKDKEMDKDYFIYYIQKNNIDGTSEAITTCTHQMAMKWLREEHDIIICIDYNEDEECEERWGFSTYQNNVRKVDLATYVTYEEAVEAVLKYCLTELV